VQGRQGIEGTGRLSS